MFHLRKHVQVFGVLAVLVGFSLNTFHFHPSSKADFSVNPQQETLVKDAITCIICACHFLSAYTSDFSNPSPLNPLTQVSIPEIHALGAQTLFTKSSRGPPLFS